MIEKIHNAKLNKSPEPVPMPINATDAVHDEPRMLSPDREAKFLTNVLGAALASHLYQVKVPFDREEEVVELTDAIAALFQRYDILVVTDAVLRLALKMKIQFHGIQLSPEANDTINKLIDVAGINVDKLLQDHIQQVRDVMTGEGFLELRAALKTKGLTVRLTDDGVLLSRGGKKPSAKDQQAVCDAVRAMVKEKEQETA